MSERPAKIACDRAMLLMERAVNMGWISVHNVQQFLANTRIALDTEVSAGGPFNDNGWNKDYKDTLEQLLSGITADNLHGES